AARLFRSESIEAVAVSFLHAAANDEHERRVAEVLAGELPGVYLTIGSEILSQIRYYDRTSTAGLNGYVGPGIEHYLSQLVTGLEHNGFAGVLVIMQSNGGVASPDEVGRKAAHTLLSGPASAPTAALAVAETHGARDCVVVDMGGTSFDVAVVS